jgi:hypothetical protein
MILKILVLCSFMVADVFLCMTVRLGISCARTICSYTRHKRMAWATFYATLVAVILTEFMVRTEGRSYRGWLFWFHLIAFAIPYLVSLPTLLLVNGLSSPWHKQLAYTATALCIGMNITGFVLWYQRF